MYIVGQYFQTPFLYSNSFFDYKSCIKDYLVYVSVLILENWHTCFIF